MPDSDHYRYKLAWLAALREAVAAVPEGTVVCGDMSIAPTDDDGFEPGAYVGQRTSRRRSMPRSPSSPGSACATPARPLAE